MSVRWVSTPSGVSIAVHHLGGEGPVLLFAPANGFHGRCYQPVAAGLNGSYQCCGIDLEGQGDSPVAEHCSTLMLQRHADDLLAVVECLSCKGDCFIVAHSGSGLSAVMAEQQQPGTFKAMYLYEPVVLGPLSTGEDTHTNSMVDEGWIRSARAAQPPEALRTLAAKRRGTFPSKEAARQFFAKRPPFSSFSRDALASYVEHGLRVLPDGTAELTCSPSCEASLFKDYMRVSAAAFARLGSISCPITIASGSNSAFFGAVEPEAPRIAAHLQQGHLDKYLTLGHLGPFECPTFVADRILYSFRCADQSVLWSTLPKTQIFPKCSL